MKTKPGYSIVWSEEDQEYVATYWLYPSMSWLGKTPRHAFDGLLHLIQSIEKDGKGD